MEKFLNRNHRDVNKEEPTEESKGYLGEFTEAVIKDGSTHKPLDAGFGTACMNDDEEEGHAANGEKDD